MKQIIFYQKQNGKIPVVDFLNDLEKKNPDLHAKVLQKIDLLTIENISRIFYFTIENEKIVLLDGIIKKTQKLDNSIIEKVKNYKNDFLSK